MAEFTASIGSLQRLPAREAVRLVMVPDAASGLPGRLRVNVDQDKAPAALEPGVTVKLRAWLMPPAPPAVPGAYDFSRAAWFQGIGGTGRALDIAVLAPAASRTGVPLSLRGASASPTTSVLASKEALTLLLVAVGALIVLVLWRSRFRAPASS